MPKASRYSELAAGVVLISFSAIFVKLAGIDPTASAFYRCFYSALILLGMAGWRNEVTLRTGPWLLPALGAGLFLAMDLIVWHKTIFYIGSGAATLLGNTQVVFVALYGRVFFKEKVSGWMILLVPFIFTGLYLAIPKSQIMVSPGIGLLLGSLVGLTYAGFLVCLHYAKRAAGPGYPEVFSLAVIMACSALVIGFYGLAGTPVSFRVTAWKAQLYLVLMALLPQSLGWVLIKTAITRIPAHQGSLFLLLQPILTIFWGKWLFGEPVSALQLFGIVLALGLIAFYQFRLAPEIGAEREAEPPRRNFKAPAR